jgi:ribonuclease T1
VRNRVAAGSVRTRLILGVVTVLLLLGVGFAVAGRTTGEATPARSGLPTVEAADLPPEARHTLTLIDSGGPFPFVRDGAVFANRERLLPRRNQGYYREYTVPTPGRDDRGARRIVAGDRGDRYYTSDHYRSFREVAR